MRKSFRTPSNATLEVLRGVSFEVEAGEMLAVMGASGAGKTTLLHVIGGLEEADGGDVLLNDFNIARARSAELARFRNREVGFVFQFHHLLPDLTAAENVLMPLLINSRGRRSSWPHTTSGSRACATACSVLRRDRLKGRQKPPVPK
ncbi:MAG: ATP-binding cassette domain-containing protein [Acidobacteria bacterium]|nr:ATP-binding cassette domain-containing protein [Acidobacteriota bacterium]